MKKFDIGDKVFSSKKKILEVLNNIGFISDGKKYIPCTDENNIIDDYPVNDLTLFVGKEVYEIKKFYFSRTGGNWENSDGKPDIDYVMWLENQLIAATNIIKMEKNR